ncbi:MAG: hypothetical protein OQL08_08880 [Gammaproteobacteria bacterium]|nr:hypothetical protein [Gammaproteobacteria bacterium]
MKLVNVRMLGYGRLDFHRRVVRGGLREQAGVVRDEARRLLGARSGGGRQYKRKNRKRKASAAGEYPAKVSGLLRRSVRARLGKRGALYATAGPDLNRAYYAQWLFQGTEHIDPRGPVMEDALENRRSEVERGLADALIMALQVRK